MPVSFARDARRSIAAITLALAAACGTESSPAKSDSSSSGAPSPTQAATPTAPDSFRVTFSTSRGDFDVDVKRGLSPRGVDRFYELVTTGYFDEARFFRVVPGFIVQFGMHPDPKVNNKWRSHTILDDPVAVTNKRGTIVFATRGPNTRANQFFINLGDNPGLDRQGFSPFGSVVSGMSVVDSIYSGYGEAPDQEQIGSAGNEYLKSQFPKLDYIKSIKIAAPAAQD